MTAPLKVGDRLLPRQRQVVTLVAASHTNPQIAAALGVTVSTVKKTLEVARFKLGARSRWHAVTRAVEAGELW